MSEAELDEFIGELLFLGEEIRVHQLAISALSSTRKTIFHKLTENGVSQAEIADLIGVSPQKVSQVLHRKE